MYKPINQSKQGSDPKQKIIENTNEEEHIKQTFTQKPNAMEYKQKNKLSDRKIAQLLGVHYNSIYAWFTLDQDPSALAKAKIQQFLIKNL